MTLVEWLLLIIAIPCAALTIAGLAIGYMAVVIWWRDWSYRMKCRLWPGYEEYASNKLKKEIKRMIAKAEKEFRESEDAPRDPKLSTRRSR